MPSGRQAAVFRIGRRDCARDVDREKERAMESAAAAPRPSPLELLELAADLSLDARRRVPATCGVLLAVAPDGERLFVGSAVPDGRVPALTEAVRRAPRAAAPDREPPALAGCRDLLAACAPLAVRSSRYFLIEPPQPRTTLVPIVRSDVAHPELRRLNPGNWEPDEWADLLAGALGPWAMALVDGRVGSLCHTPGAMTARAAECGVWTHPDYRGRGYAGAVTAAWAALLQPSGRALFYSTDAGNRASQRVAAHLHLRPLGRIWRLARADHGPRDARHPLSRRAAAPTDRPPPPTP
jgi:RimJ/RimL family protein N-acetyltransferase